jgi:hypothetical protein
MRSRFRNGIYLLALLPLLSFSDSDEGDALVGKWSENWGVNEETDVDYHDIYWVTVDPNHKYDIRPEKDYYRFDDIRWADSVLSFNLINTTGMDTMPYWLKFNKKNTDKLEGKAYSVQKELRTIEWVRVRE